CAAETAAYSASLRARRKQPLTPLRCVCGGSSRSLRSAACAARRSKNMLDSHRPVHLSAPCEAMIMRTVNPVRKTSAPNLRPIADAVVQRAQREGLVRPKEVQEELHGAGESKSLWKDVLALARESLIFRNG